MTRILTESQAQAEFSQLITDACNGEEIIITRNNTPAVRLSLVSKVTDKTEDEQQALMQQREKAIAAIKALRKKVVIGPPITIEEIISARDEGRKYL